MDIEREAKNGGQNVQNAGSLWEEKKKKREQCISILLTEECATILTDLIARSNKYPILVNEGIVAISLLATHKLGGMIF